MAQQAHSIARSLLVTAGKRDATAQDRRAFQSHLITLPSYRNPDCTLFFSTLVTKYFTEFEDLQDRAVDAVLDLCEDEEEQTRIIGIKGLGSTARADPKWVRGNAGVLLQLLECPERELREVKNVLSALLAQSPVEVLAVMGEHCKSSEEDTHTSRRNILEYLYSDCAAIRATVLESGKNTAAEAIFRSGFLEALKVTPVAETRMVLEMLVPLSTISGPTAKPEVTNAFIRALSDSLKADSSTTVTIRHIQLFSDLVKRVPGANIDARVALYFFGQHGGAVVEAVVEKQDETALALIKKMSEWVDEAVQLWSKGKEGAEDKLVRDCVLAMLEEALETVKDAKKAFIIDAATRLEHILLPLYSLVRCGDRRQTLINAHKKKDLKALANVADTVADTYSRKTELGRCVRNIRDMADILRNDTKSFENIKPSWAPTAPSPPSRAAALPQTRVPSATTSVGVRAPSGPRSTAQPIPDVVASSSRSRMVAGDRAAPTGPRQVSPARRSPPARPAISFTASTTRPAAKVIASAPRARDGSLGAGSSSTTHARRRSASPAQPRSPSRTRQSPRARTPDIPAQVARPAISAQREQAVTAPPVPMPSNASIRGRSTAAEAPSLGRSSAQRERELSPDRSAPTNFDLSRSTSSRGIELLSAAGRDHQPSEAAGPSKRADSPKPLHTHLPAVPGPALAGRLAPRDTVAGGLSARSMSIKRQRDDAMAMADEATTSESAMPNPISIVPLSARLGGRTEPDLKRSKTDGEASSGRSVSLASRLSLKDRLGSASGSTSPSPSPALMPAQIPASSGPKPLNILNRASPAGVSGSFGAITMQTTSPSPAGLSIRRNGQASTAQTPTPSDTPTRPSVNVLGRSSSQINTVGLSINGRSNTPAAPATPAPSTPAPAPVEDAPIRRKGRGFERDSDGDWDMNGGPSESAGVAIALPTHQPSLPVFQPPPFSQNAVPGRGTVQPFRPFGSAAARPIPVQAGGRSLLSRLGMAEGE